jgi:5-enolpyruvylshikimate-3-phosphate synthase
MSAAIAAIIGGVSTTIDDISCVKTSFPNFFDLLMQWGAHVKTYP